MAELNKIRVQQKLVEIGLAGPYYQVAYDANEADDVDPETAEVVAPVSAQANEVASGWDTDTQYGRNKVQGRTNWEWRLQLSFSKEVTLEAAEEAWSSS